MSRARSLLDVPALAVSVAGTALTAVGLVVVGLGSVAAQWSRFGFGIGMVLVVYGVLVGAGAWLGMRRSRVGLGLMVAPALLHLAVAVDLGLHGDTPQRVGAWLAAALFVTILVAAFMPSTRRALSPDDQLREQEEL